MTHRSREYRQNPGLFSQLRRAIHATSGTPIRIRLARFAGMRRDLIDRCPQGVQEFYLKGLLFLVVASLACLSMTFLLYAAFSGQLLGGDIHYATWDEALAQAAASSASASPPSPPWTANTDASSPRSPNACAGGTRP